MNPADANSPRVARCSTSGIGPLPHGSNQKPKIEKSSPLSLFLHTTHLPFDFSRISCRCRCSRPFCYVTRLNALRGCSVVTAHAKDVALSDCQQRSGRIAADEAVCACVVCRSRRKLVGLALAPFAFIVYDSSAYCFCPAGGAFACSFVPSLAHDCCLRIVGNRCRVRTRIVHFQFRTLKVSPERSRRLRAHVRTMAEMLFANAAFFEARIEARGQMDIRP